MVDHRCERTQRTSPPDRKRPNKTYKNHGYAGLNLPLTHPPARTGGFRLARLRLAKKGQLVMARHAKPINWHKLRLITARISLHISKLDLPHTWCTF